MCQLEAEDSQNPAKSNRDNTMATEVAQVTNKTHYGHLLLPSVVISMKENASIEEEVFTNIG